MTRLVERIVDASGRRPLLVLFAALAVLAGSWTCALGLDLRSDLLELLPRDSPGFRAFERQTARIGGDASLLVVVQSPDRAANERFVDALAVALDGEVAARASSPHLIAYVEHGTKDVRRFFEDNKWLYADVDDLERADATVDREVAVRSGLVSDLDESPGAPSALGLDDLDARWRPRLDRLDPFPTGYFATGDGTLLGVRIVSTTTGMGDRGGDALLDRVRAIVATLRPASFGPAITVGYAGDIPNAIEEKASLIENAVVATGVAVALVVAGVVFFFRSVWALPVLGLPAAIGVGCAYAFARIAYGYVNTTGAFLGAIILGNGINYPIVLLARYREFRARGDAPADARRAAARNALRAELVGATVASVAYGSLVVTRFRGFTQFGAVGFFGMLLVWLSMIPVVPAMLVVLDRVQERLPSWLRERPWAPRDDGSRSALMRLVARVTARSPWAVLAVGLVVTGVAASRLPAFLRDPWEYDFARLGSKATSRTGAGEWSNKADRVFGGKMNVAGARMLADEPSQVPLLKARILANDAADPKGRLVAEVATVDDVLPGSPSEQARKLELLGLIRARLTPAVLARLRPSERARVEAMTPPATLKVLTAADLPPLLRRRFSENDGRIGTVFYVRYKNDVSLSDGRNLLRIAKTTDDVALPDGTVVHTASRATVFAEMIRSMERDGPLATAASFTGVVAVVLLATANARGAVVVLSTLVVAVACMLGAAAAAGAKLNFLDFIALPITFGIGCEYPFNVYDRARLLGGDVSAALTRTGGAVALCSYTTAVGYAALLFADNQALSSFGELAMAGEVACLVAAVVLLPALLHVLRTKTSPPRTASLPQ